MKHDIETITVTRTLLTSAAKELIHDAFGLFRNRLIELGTPAHVILNVDQLSILFTHDALITIEKEQR